MGPLTAGWSLADMPELTGKTVVVTGANSGLGYHASAAFAARGADVVMACRSLERGAEARAEIADRLTDPSLTVRELDLADLESVRLFAETFQEEHDELHRLCNNAGVMAVPRSETADGFEYQLGVNHLGHFALTGHLLDTILETEDETRVVTQSSAVHESGGMRFEDLQWEEGYDEWGAYAQSKLANLLFAYELDRRLRDAGRGAETLSVACHPGYAATNLQRRGPEMSGSKARLWAMELANLLVAQSAERGALPLLYAATHSGVVGGEYVGPGGLMGMRGAPEPQRSSPASYDEGDAERLWELSEELTGVGFEI